MKRRPVSVIVISLLLAAAGAVGLVYHFREINFQHPFQNEALGVALIRLSAILAGVYMLRARNWARWLAILWIGFHVVVSAFHSVPELAFHGVLLAIFSYVLFRPRANSYFRANEVR